MANETNTTNASNNESVLDAALEAEVNRRLSFVVHEMSANLRHMESHLATLATLARAITKSQRRAMNMLERDVDSMLTLIQRGHRQARKHLPKEAGAAEA